VIENLDCGKAAGKPGMKTLTCEHLLYCHPISIVTITKLFKLPRQFGFKKGLVVVMRVTQFVKWWIILQTISPQIIILC